MDIPDRLVSLQNEQVALSRLGDRQTIHVRNKWRLLLWWVFANTSGAVVGALVAEAVTHGLFRFCYSCVSTIEALRVSAITGLIIGAVIGLVEWLVLRVYTIIKYWWVAATMFGWGSAIAGGEWIQDALGLYNSDRPPATWEPLVVGLTVGAIIGACQAIILRRQVRSAWLWMLSNILAWGVLMIGTPTIFRGIEHIRLSSGDVISWDEETLKNILRAIWLFGVIELTTGLTLLWLLARTQASYPEPSQLSDSSPQLEEDPAPQ